MFSSESRVFRQTREGVWWSLGVATSISLTAGKTSRLLMYNTSKNEEPPLHHRQISRPTATGERSPVNVSAHRSTNDALLVARLSGGFRLCGGAVFVDQSLPVVFPILVVIVVRSVFDVFRIHDFR